MAGGRRCRTTHGRLIPNPHHADLAVEDPGQSAAQPAGAQRAAASGGWFYLAGRCRAYWTAAAVACCSCRCSADLLFSLLLRMPRRLRGDCSAWAEDTARGFVKGNAVTMLQPGLSAAPGADLDRRDRALHAAGVRHRARDCSNGRRRRKRKRPRQQGDGRYLSGMDALDCAWPGRVRDLVAAAASAARGRAVLVCGSSRAAFSAWLNRPPRTAQSQAEREGRAA